MAKVGSLTQFSGPSGHLSGTESHSQPISVQLIAITRLNYNHLLLKEFAGYLINPRIPTSQENIRIADVGTGTA